MKMRLLLINFTLAALILSAFSYPQYGYNCNNWCPQNNGYICCDYGYSGGYNPVNPFNPNTNVMSSKTYCPFANCTTGSTVFAGECADDDDCKRKEMCCENPCNTGKKMCVEHVKKNPVEKGCKAVTNCRDWARNNDNPVSCKDDNDCKRSDTCCSVPCKSQKVCQKTEASSTGNTGPGTDTGTGTTNLCY